MRLLVALVLLSCSLVSAASPPSVADSESSYVTVREGAHMYWWLQGCTGVASSQRASAPLIIWLQGGPGGSSTGFGNFNEIGPYDVNLQPRKNTWLQSVNLLFIDNPVGTGYSYADNPNAFATNITTIANDLVILMQSFYATNPQLQQTPLWVFCESYGGKMTAAFGVALYKAIQAGHIKANFKGVALGDSWISPVDSTLSWASYLQSLSLLDDQGYNAIDQVAKQAQQAVQNGQYSTATDLWGQTENLIEQYTDGVNFYNVLQHNQADESTVATKNIKRTSLQVLRRNHLEVYSSNDALSNLMNGAVRNKLGNIPSSVTWGGQANDVFQANYNDFMLDVISDVDYLLSTDLQVIVYQGQLDVICATPGTNEWIRKLTWNGLSAWNNATRTPLYTAESGNGNTQGFVKTYDNFSYYYILNAGHMVPTDNAPMALQMMQTITGTLPKSS